MGSPIELAWFGCDLATGNITEDLRSVKPSGPLARRLGDATTLQMELTVAGAPKGWDAATAPGRSMLVAVDEGTDQPIWAGVVLPRERGSAPAATIGLATPERYLDSRFPGTVRLFGADQADVVTALVTPALTSGIPLVLDAPPTGVPMDFEVEDGDDRSTLSCLQEIMALEAGPEWTIDVEWNAGRNGFVLPLRVRPAIGVQTPEPEGTFDYPGCVSSYSLAESYEQGKGATRVRARGEGEGVSRLTSPPMDATGLLAAGWPLWEHRYTPATGLTDPDQLTGHAARAVALMGQGAQVWTLDAVASKSPRLGREWALGDSVRLTVESSPGHPNGADITARAWAWELDPDADTVRPILVQED